ncbi:MAG: branched-chain amino acid transporter permease [Oscillospiraceae bacterium]
MLTTGQAIASIAVMAIVTFLTRALPFLLFDRGESPPKIVLYLGRVLPPAVIAMLIIYCLRSPSLTVPAELTADLSGWLASVVSFFVGWAPQLIAGAVVVLLHVWKHNNLLSIFGGTILYMILVQFVFV